jgi:hypothetical protein
VIDFKALMRSLISQTCRKLLLERPQKWESKVALYRSLIISLFNLKLPGPRRGYDWLLKWQLVWP